MGVFAKIQVLHSSPTTVFKVSTEELIWIKPNKFPYSTCYILSVNNNQTRDISLSHQCLKIRAFHDCSEESTTQNHLVWPLTSISHCFRLRLITRRAEQQLDFHFHQPVLISSTSKSTITALRSVRKWKLLFPFDFSEGPQGEKTKPSRQEFCQCVITGLPTC